MRDFFSTCFLVAIVVRTQFKMMNIKSICMQLMYRTRSTFESSSYHMSIYLKCNSSRRYIRKQKHQRTQQQQIVVTTDVLRKKDAETLTNIEVGTTNAITTMLHELNKHRRIIADKAKIT